MSKPSTGRSRGLLILMLAAIVFFILNRIPFGHYFQWTFVVITTFVHEMGHGLTAILTGGNLLKVEIYKNASGLAIIETVGGWR